MTETTTVPDVGDPAPEFTLRGARGDTFRLAALRGLASVVLFFYPKDQTSG